MKNHNWNGVLVKAGKNIVRKYRPGSPDSTSRKGDPDDTHIILNLINFTINSAL
jgi:hypothetical protein